jgi:excinuclease ABC subunit A
MARALAQHLRGLPLGEGLRELRCHAPVTRVVAADRHAAVSGDGSTLASYAGVWDGLRALFAKTPEARARKLIARHFSLAAPGGRCEACHGQGVVTVAMDFLPDVSVDCEACGGARFLPEVLATRLCGRSPAAGITAMGLGYLRLGQATSSLSDGELQRASVSRRCIPLAGRRAPWRSSTSPPRGCFTPTSPSSSAILRRLADSGATLVVVEHNRDVVAAADFVIEIGPEAGPEGGHIVAQGPPEVFASSANSHTGRALRALAQH